MQLKVTMLEIYNSRLEQRERRKELSVKLNLMDPVLSEVRARDRGFEQFRNSMYVKYYPTGI